jgi:hypothetical protein
MGSKSELTPRRDDEDRPDVDLTPGVKLSGKDVVTVATVLGYLLAAYVGLQMVGWV